MKQNSLFIIFTQHMENVNFRESLILLQHDLLNFAYKLTLDRDLATDLLQETSLRALDNEEKYTPNTNLKSWLYTIMRNIFINNHNRTLYVNNICDTAYSAYKEDILTDLTAFSYDYSHDFKEIKHIVSHLPNDFRTPFLMHVAGFKYREISEKMNVPIGTIKSRISSTRIKLQHVLKDFRD